MLFGFGIRGFEASGALVVQCAGFRICGSLLSSCQDWGGFWCRAPDICTVTLASHGGCVGRACIRLGRDLNPTPKDFGYQDSGTFGGFQGRPQSKKRNIRQQDARSCSSITFQQEIPPLEPQSRSAQTPKPEARKPMDPKSLRTSMPKP